MLAAFGDVGLDVDPKTFVSGIVVGIAPGDLPLRHSWC